MYDWQLSNIRFLLKSEVEHSTQTELKISSLEKERLQLETQIQQLATRYSTLQTTPDESVPPSDVITPETTTVLYAAKGSTGNTISDIYDPENNTGKQSQLDKIKRQYEEILITYFFMEHCKKSGQNDFHIIISALSQEMASINAPGRLQYDIVNAAKGSYKEMYSTSNCNDTNVTTTYKDYSNYINSISQNFTVR